MKYDRIIAVDWSARSKPSPRKPTKDAIFICISGQHPTYHRTRAAAIDYVSDVLQAALAAGQKVLIGFDFSFGYPVGFAKKLTGSDRGLAVWSWLADHIKDGPDNSNNRFAVIKDVNALFEGIGPFWGCPMGVEDEALPAKGSLRHGHGMAERRAVEDAVSSAQSTWKLFTTGSVGSQSLLGLPYLWALKQHYREDLAVWPLETGFEQPDAKITVVEIYPSLMRPECSLSLEHAYPHELYDILDAKQVRWVCDQFDTMNKAETWPDAFEVCARLSNADQIAQEGWILGATAA
ncbi:hypothetical protein [Algirhabdus cladophorae]|uniref:hypothetical protein n=1 Tax=Algirhabdus cladophorae TaxID=3377108 RepID=UPI003B847CBB